MMNLVSGIVCSMVLARVCTEVWSLPWFGFMVNIAGAVQVFYLKIFVVLTRPSHNG